MPTRARHRCVSCGNGVMTVKQPCSHCGAPDPLDAGPVVPAIVRCQQCGNPTHVAAEACRKCRTPSGGFTPDDAAPSFRESTEISRAAAEARAVAEATGRAQSSQFAARAASGGMAINPGPLAAPLWDPTRAPIETHAPVRRPISEPVVFPSPSAGSEAAADPPLSASLVDRIPCGRCGELQPRGTRQCVRCGIADPERAEPLERRKPLFGLVTIPTLPLVVTIVGLLALGALTFYTQVTKEEQRKQRIWQAFGSQASESKIAQLEHEAAVIGVSTDVLLRIRFFCLHREAQRPSAAELRQIRVSAEAGGTDPEKAVSEAARGACGR